MFKIINTSKHKWINQQIGGDFQTVTYNDKEAATIEMSINKKVVQYYFCLNGSMTFKFNQGTYSLPLSAGENCFFYNPEKDLVPTIETSQGSSIIFIFCSIEKIHQLFLDNSSELEFLNSENVNKKIYKKVPTGSDTTLVLRKIIDSSAIGPAHETYRYAKILEALSLYFISQSSKEKVSCPYLQDEEVVNKIKQAKDLLVQNLSTPPTIPQLAKQVDLNEYRLKEGFKNLYGSTMFQFLLDYKMMKGKLLLDSGGFKIKEVAYDLGYHNPSHFITAFKNKFGLTPKKYLLSK